MLRAIIEENINLFKLNREQSRILN